MITLIFVIIIIVAVAAFSAQNATPVAVTFLLWHFEASLALIIVLSLLGGMIIGMALLSLLRLRRSVRAKRKATTDADSAGANKPR